MKTVTERKKNKKAAWLSEEDREILLFKKGQSEGAFLGLVLPMEDVKTLAKFNLNEYQKDPRRVSGIVGRIYKEQIVKHSLGFRMDNGELKAGRHTIFFFDGFRRACMDIYDDFLKSQNRERARKKATKRASIASRKVTRNPIKRDKRK